MSGSAVLHPAFGYFLDEFGMRQIALEADGKEPTQKGLVDLGSKAEDAGLALERPTSGPVLVFDRAAAQAHREVGYVPQSAVFDPSFPISVGEVVRMGRLRGSWGRCRRGDMESVRGAMDASGIGDLADQPYSSLSGGQRRRALVARALASEPRLLALDEPSANMDAQSEEMLLQTLGRLKGRTTVLIVTHDSTFVSALTDSVLCIGVRPDRRGRVVLHPAAPALEGLPPQYRGDTALRVIHDEELPDDDCFASERES